MMAKAFLGLYIISYYCKVYQCYLRCYCYVLLLLLAVLLGLPGPAAGGGRLPLPPHAGPPRPAGRQGSNY